ncbi:MAG TPA: hypothetical protein VFQ27_03880 [Xanthobacteraceae bacterium]|nr:hypothetical protein [Xanthobacteraceae bacterium]
MPCEELVRRCFLDEAAPLAVPEFSRERALAYLECCYRQGLSWEDAERQIAACLSAMGVPPEGVARQLNIAKPLLQPWLD